MRWAIKLSYVHYIIFIFKYGRLQERETIFQLEHKRDIQVHSVTQLEDNKEASQVVQPPRPPTTARSSQKEGSSSGVASSQTDTYSYKSSKEEAPLIPA